MAVKRLVERYRNGRHARPEMLPVIELQKSSYMNKEQGVKVYVPVFKLVDWQTNSPAKQAPEADPELDDSIPF